MSRTKLYLAATPLIFGLSCGLQFAARSTNSETAAGGQVSLKLDVSPMTSPFSTLILLNQDGNASAVRYSRSQPAVVSIREGKTPRDIQTRLKQQIHEADFANACRGLNFGAGGLSRGDQFQLLVKSEEGAERYCLGFIDDAPLSVRQVITDLVGLPQRLSPVTLADAYVRSEVVTVERQAAIRRAGQMRFVSLASVARDLQPLLSDSVSRPREFIPLSRQQYEAIRTLIAPTYDFILTTDGSGSQLTLFPAQPAPSSKGDYDETLNSRPPPDAQVLLACPIGIAGILRAPDYRSRW